MSPAALSGVFALAVLQGALVAMPDAGAFGGLTRARSPAWAVLLPGMIVLGTFGVLELPATALGLVVLSALATPLLAAVSVLAVVRVPRAVRRRRAALLGGVAALTALTVAAGGLVAQLAQDVITGLGCLCLGVVIVRLIPRRCLPASVLALCVVDVVLLALGPGVSAYGAMTHATDGFHGPSFDHAAVGMITLDYPDLVLTAMLGSVLAHDRAGQRRAAVLLATVAGLYGLLVAFIDVIPATVPITLSYLLVRRRRAPQA
jgi:hypothetical protein